MRQQTLSRFCLGLAFALASVGVAAQSTTDAAATSQDTMAQDTDASKNRGDKPDFATLDADGNGQVSRSEAAAHSKLASKFDKLDANKDGALSSAELESGHMSGHDKGAKDSTTP